MKRIIYIASFILAFCLNATSQEYVEYYFKFNIEDKSELDTITQIISIENVKNLEVFAYATQQEFDDFKKLNYKIEFLPSQNLKSYTMATTVADMATWDKYPTYEVYREMMKNFESDYPSICKLDSIGTTNNGRKLYVLKISDNVEIEENEPEFFYTSTMHGNEATGFVLMLRLVDSILTSYNSETRITNLVNEIEIFINPNANPDGTYYGGNNTITGAVRSNGIANLNRDYPDPRTGANSPYQPETQAMMDFAENHNFIMSANFHGGAEVMNYPWDTWRSIDNSHVDANWYESVCTDYVNTARLILPSYMSDTYSDGVTEGGDWYVIAGGRQDYMNFWHQCREITIEISSTKLLASESLNNYWNYNKESFLDFMNECLYGIRGTVTNHKGDPLDAMIWIENHDSYGDSSMVYTDNDIGDYHRMIEAGTYNLVVSSDGYINDIAKNIIVTNGNIVWKNFILSLADDSISLVTKPQFIDDTLYFNEMVEHEIIIFNDSNATNTSYTIEIENGIDNNWLELNKSSGIITESLNDTIILTIKSNTLNADNYFANILVTAADLKIDTIPVNILVKDTISSEFQPKFIQDTLWGGDSSEYKFNIKNTGIFSFNYSLQIESEEPNNWLNLNQKTGNILINESDTITLSIFTKDLGFGNFHGNIILFKENSTNDTVLVNIYVKDTIASEVLPARITDTLYPDISKQYSVVVKNIGNQNLVYSTDLHFANNSDLWLSQNKTSGILYPEQTDTIILTVNTADLLIGNYLCTLALIENNNDTILVPINIFVNNIQQIENEPSIVEFKIYPNPFNNQINIEFVPIGYKKIRIDIFNIFGSSFFTQEINIINNTVNHININDYTEIDQFPIGIYFIQISTSDFKVSKKLIKNQ